MNSVPVFSIVIPSYNYGHFLGACLESVFAQQRDDIEILVIDDASDDNTPELAAAYGDRIQYFRNAENLGAGGAWQRGLGLASGRYLVKLDADDELLPGHLDRVEAAFTAHPDAAMVMASVVVNNETSGRRHDENLAPPTGLLDASAFRQRLLRSFFFRMPSCALRRACLEGHEPPDPQLFQVHDWEYFLRISQGHPAVLLDQASAVYRVHEASITSVARSGDRLASDLQRWLDKASEPGDYFITPADRKVLAGSFAVLLATSGMKSLARLETWPHFMRSYFKAWSLGAEGGVGQIVRLHGALLNRLGRLAGKPFRATP